MAAIDCPDCGKQVSEIADACPNCGRPEPGKTKEQIESDSSSAAFGLLWLGHAILVGYVKGGFWYGFAALFFGPLVWFVPGK